MNELGKHTNPDVLIIGGGPAGISAAIWCRELGQTCLLIEKEAQVGGQMNRIFSPIVNFPGLVKIEPSDLISTFTKQLSNFDIPRMDASAVKFTAQPLSIELSNGEAIRPNALVIATGVRRRKLDVPGELEFAGRGIVDSGAREPSAVSGKTILIVGGGDAAIENAIILSPFAKKICVIHRRAKSAARDEFMRQVKVLNNVEFITNSSVVRFDGMDRLESATVQSLITKLSTKLDVENALIRIGVTPNSDLFRDSVKTNPAGYIEVDSACRTSVNGIYAVGDVANPIGPTIATAIGMGATAAKAILIWNSQKKSI